VGYILVPEAAVTLTAIPNTGYQFVRWENPADGTTLATPVNTFPMPNDDITLTPIFEEIP
jgi:uncharacterized repeat protein (TIGR02543 family)